MSARYFRMDDHAPAREQWALPVPWKLVPVLAGLPGARQFAAELFVDPVTKRAAIVLWPGVDPRFVTALLTKLERPRERSPPGRG